KTKNDTRPYYSTMKPLQFATMSFLDQQGVSYHFGAQAKTLSRGAGGVRLSREIASLLPNLPLDEGCGRYNWLDKECGRYNWLDIECGRYSKLDIECGR
ncbi:hypothetical protein SARC_17697, partial [Sphaeroforma arctica JP610]